VHKLKGSVGVLSHVISTQQKFKVLLEVVRDITGELYTGTRTTRQVVKTGRQAVSSSHNRGKERIDERKPTTILQALEDLMEDVCDLVVGLDAFSEFNPEMASIYTKDLQSEIKVHFFWSVYCYTF
jgi:hypothetical protein